MERFYVALNRFDAYLVLHRLQRAGIPAHVFNEHVQSIVGDVPPDVAQPQVWLEDARDRPRAEKELAAMKSERMRRGTLRCPACGEESPATFELCWKCGASL
jgi:hypothetical protein